MDLLTRAAVRVGSLVAVLTPYGPNTEALDSPVEDLRTSGTIVESAGDIYRSAWRLQLGAEIAQEMSQIVRGLTDNYRVHVIVHNEELLPLVRSLQESVNVRIGYFSHGLVTQEHPGFDSIFALQKDIFTEAKVIFVASRSQAELVYGLFGRFPEVVPMPLGLLLENAGSSASEWPISDGKYGHTFLAAGRMVPQKGVDILLDALALMHSPPACTIVSGHGDELYERKCRMIAHHHSLDVNWLPWTSNANVAGLLTHAKALVMPSRFEPLGILAAESIAVGTPVVGSDVGGLSEILRATHQTYVRMTKDGPDRHSLAAAMEAVTGERVGIRDRMALGAWTCERTVRALRGSLEFK